MQQWGRLTSLAKFVTHASQLIVYACSRLQQTFFSKFENAEMKQEAPIPVKEEVLVVEKSEPEVKKDTNGLDKLTVNLDTPETSVIAVKKATPKVAKVS